MTVIAAPTTSSTPDQVVWYRHPDQLDDHAFGTTSGYLRSRCGEVRWNVRMALVEGTVRACPRCLKAIDGWIESERRLAHGDR